MPEAVIDRGIGVVWRCSVAVAVWCIGAVLQLCSGLQCCSVQSVAELAVLWGDDARVKPLTCSLGGDPLAWVFKPGHLWSRLRSWMGVRWSRMQWQAYMQSMTAQRRSVLNRRDAAVILTYLVLLGVCVVRSVLPVLMLPLPYSSPRGPFPTAPSLSSNSRIIYCLHATSTGKGSAVIAGVEENSGSRGKGSSRVPDAGIKTNEHQVGRGISPGGRMEGE
eukprot:1141460-Pelagomonas_calceolata.AAC.2